MSEFETQLVKFVEESQAIQKEQREIEAKSQIFNEKLSGFVREHGLPENFTLPEVMMLAVRKSKS